MGHKILLEVGVEELPARFIDQAIQQLQCEMKKWLTNNRVQFSTIQMYSTPRRLAVIVHDVASSQETLEKEVRGPSEKIAKNEDGSWSKAAIGFTKGQGKQLGDIYIKKENDTPYIFVKKIIEGKKTFEILPKMKEVIKAISFPQTMYWDHEAIAYARPIRWIVALFDDEVIPFELAKVNTDRITYGHRFLGDRIILQHVKDYEQALVKNYVIADAKKREEQILNGIQQLERENGFSVLVNKSLLNEVRNLVEYPTVFSGSFRKQFLHLPKDVLITAMEEHQRYFSVKSKEGKLMPYFIGVRNGDEYALETVIKGNEKVLEARLSDAQFFYDEDLSQSIDVYLNKLKNVIFQEKLGTYAEKVKRVRNIAKHIAEKLSCDRETTSHLLRAAEISKFDLVTQMVNEFPELQGIIGEKYALSYNENKNVATAIREHYLPLHAGGELPQTKIGAILSVADKLDTIVGCITAGIIPSGSQDPYALRRQAIGILQILRAEKWQISVEELLQIALAEFDQKEINKAEIINFFILRARYILKEANIEQDVITSVLHKGIGYLLYTIEKANMLSAKRNDPTFKTVEEALVRVLNLAKKANETTIDETLFQSESERELYHKFQQIYAKYDEATKNLNAKEALNALSELAKPIHNFFDHNMVMDDDLKIRNNRLALLKNIAKLIDHFADLASIQWKQKSDS